MRLSVLIIVLLAVVVWGQQEGPNDRRSRARARFLALASRAKEGDPDALAELKARRRPRVNTETVPARPSFRELKPTPLVEPSRQRSSRLRGASRASEASEASETSSRNRGASKTSSRNRGASEASSRNRGASSRSRGASEASQTNRGASEASQVNRGATRTSIRRSRVRFPRPVTPKLTTTNRPVFPQTTIRPSFPQPTTFRPAPLFPILTPKPVVQETGSGLSTPEPPTTELFTSDPVTEPDFFSDGLETTPGAPGGVFPGPLGSEGRFLDPEQNLGLEQTPGRLENGRILSEAGFSEGLATEGRFLEPEQNLRPESAALFSQGPPENGPESGTVHKNGPFLKPVPAPIFDRPEGKKLTPEKLTPRKVSFDEPRLTQEQSGLLGPGVIRTRPGSRKVIRRPTRPVTLDNSPNSPHDINSRVERPRQTQDQSGLDQRRPTRPVNSASHSASRAPSHTLEISSRVERPRQNRDQSGPNERRRPEVVGTTRRYSYFDEAGNYIFGYEAADGSFKEEIRGLNCIVTGKYGYIDPDGVRREFTYTSGNECDPNATPDADGELPPLPLNDQFLKQTQERKLSDAELKEVQFNRNQARQKPQESIFGDARRPSVREQVFRGATRSQQVSTRTQQVSTRDEHETRPEHVFRPQSRPQESARPQERSQARPQDTFRAVTPVPSPFTTPASFNRFTTPRSFNRARSEARPQATPEPTIAVTPEPPVTSPVTPVRFRPTTRPQFDFNREFQNLFNHFAVPTQRSFVARPQPVTARPSPVTPSQFRPQPVTPSQFSPQPVTARPAPSEFSPQPVTPSAFRPQPLTVGPSFRPTPAPVTSRPVSPGPVSSKVPQLVFDAKTGTFKTVLTPFSPPAVTVRPSFGVPLPLATHGAPGSTNLGSPLPRVPLGGLSIHSPGRSPATDEFDSFFKQFNLSFL